MCHPRRGLAPLQLVASALDWAKHRRRKAAAKCHLRLDLHSFLPRFALVGTAGEHDSVRAREVCAGALRRVVALVEALWQKLELRSLLEVYGTAGGGGRFLGTPQQAFLAGFV